MPGGIYAIHDDGNVVEMKEELYRTEDVFQALLADHPQLLAGDQIDEDDPRRWLLVSREAPIPSEEDGSGRWALDHLFLDQDGVPTLVEVKRSTDSRLRREVVGQMLDYAANLSAYIPIQKLQDLFEQTCEKGGLVSDVVLGAFLEGKKDADAFWGQVKTNLQAGRIRLLFVADVIPQELRRIVEFLNQQMDPAEVLAVQVSHYVGQGLRTLVPRLFGQTVEAQQKKLAQGSPWNSDRFLRTLAENRNETEVKSARDLISWGNELPRFIYWGRGKETGYFVPQIKHNDRNYQFFQVSTTGRINFPFGAYKDKPPFDSEDKKRELALKLNDFLPEKIPLDNLAGGYPGISLSALNDQQVLLEFKRTFGWFAEQVLAT